MEKLTGHGRPAPKFHGEVGQHYEDLDTGDIWECRIAGKYSPTHGWPVGGYVWERRAKGEDIQEIYGSGGSGGSGGGSSDRIRIMFTTSVADANYDDYELYECTEESGFQPITVNELYNKLEPSNIFNSRNVDICYGTHWVDDNGDKIFDGYMLCDIARFDAYSNESGLVDIYGKGLHYAPPGLGDQVRLISFQLHAPSGRDGNDTIEFYMSELESKFV